MAKLGFALAGALGALLLVFLLMTTVNASEDVSCGLALDPEVSAKGGDSIEQATAGAACAQAIETRRFQAVLVSIGVGAMVASSAATRRD